MADREGLIIALVVLFAGSILTGCAHKEPEFHKELRHHQLDRAKSILKENPKLIDAKGRQGQPALHHAVLRLDCEGFELLIDYGANVNAKDKRGLTALHHAVKWGYRKMAESLIAHGAEVNVEDKEGKTPLDTALLYNRHDLAELLRKHGGHE